jgi:hypothetical protein
LSDDRASRLEEIDSILSARASNSFHESIPSVHSPRSPTQHGTTKVAHGTEPETHPDDEDDLDHYDEIASYASPPVIRSRSEDASPNVISTARSADASTNCSDETPHTSPGRRPGSSPLTAITMSVVASRPDLPFLDTAGSSQVIGQTESVTPILMANTPAAQSNFSAASSPGRCSVRSNRQSRVPGGAAAKLMLLGPRSAGQVHSPPETPVSLSANKRIAAESPGANSFQYPIDEENDEQDPEGLKNASMESANSAAVKETLKEIHQMLEQGRKEFDVGTPANRRYQSIRPPTAISSFSDAATPRICGNKTTRDAHPPGPVFDNKKHNNFEPSIPESDGRESSTIPFQRTDIFHETAAAAVAALLTPRERWTQHGDNMSMAGSTTDVHSVTSGHLSTKSSFQAPVSPRIAGMSAVHAPYESISKRDVTSPLISPEVERKLLAMPSRMHTPNKTLADLLVAIASPSLSTTSGNTSPAVMDLAYMVRRKNACGALQVLTAQAKNRVRIAWTVGVLPALASVLTDSGDAPLAVLFRDIRIRNEFVEARKRAISALMNLAVPKENRIPVCHTPELVPALVTVIQEDRDAAMRGGCAILASLAKSVDNRLLMVQVPGLVDALTKVLRPRPPRVESPASSPGRKSYAWSSNDSRSSDEDSHSRLDASETFTSNPSYRSKHTTASTDSEKTPKVIGSQTAIELSGYDENADEMLRGARQNAFATLSHLVKEKDNAYHLARDTPLVSTLVMISKHEESDSHTLALKLIANLTRHRLNTKLLVFKHRFVVPALVVAAEAVNDDTRLYACLALQNLAQDKSCRQELAIAKDLIAALCRRAREAPIDDERLAAVSALKNLCDEPANLIPITNTPAGISTLMHLAHGGGARGNYDLENNEFTLTLQYRACDGLATLSHWLRKIATSGAALVDEDERLKKQQQSDHHDETKSHDGSSVASFAHGSSSGGVPGQHNQSRGLFVPSLRVISWNQFE